MSTLDLDTLFCRFIDHGAEAPVRSARSFYETLDPVWHAECEGIRARRDRPYCTNSRGARYRRAGASLYRITQNYAGHPRGEYGAGTVSQIKTGKGAGNWRAYLTVDGKRRTFFAKTEDEVKAKLLDARHAVAHHAPVAPPRVLSVGTYVQEWLTDQRDHLRPSGSRAARSTPTGRAP